MARRSSYPQLQIEVTADASGVRQGLTEVKTQIEGLNNDLKRQAAVTEKTFKTASEAAKASGVSLKEYRSVLKEVETDQYKAARSTERWVNAVKDSTAYLQGQEAVLRRRAEVLGVSADVVEREIAAYRKTRDAINDSNAALRAGGRQLDQFGMTARQTSAALRQVPAQFTDIVVSLQGGQAPLTVLLQQGGQLKDVFGGVGNAVRALGGYMLTLVTPLNAVLAALAGVGLAYYKGSQEADAFNKAILLSGSYGTVTAGSLQDVAAAAVGVGVSHGAAADAIAQFVSAGVKGRDVLASYAASAVKFSDTFGVKIEDLVKNFAKLGEDPLKASVDLTGQLNLLTVATYDQIRALIDSGKASEAATLAQSTYSEALKETVKRAQEDLGLLERLWNRVKEATTKTVDAAKGIGRQTTTQELLDFARRDYESFAKRQGLSESQMARGLAARQTRIDGLEAEVRQIEEAERKQTQLNEANRAYIQIIDSSVTPLDKQRAALAAMGVELDKVREATKLGLEGFTPERLAQAEAAYKKFFEEVSKKLKQPLTEFEKSAQAGLKLFGDLTAQDVGLAPDFAEKWQKLADAFTAGKLSAEQVTQAQKILLDQQPFLAEAAKEQKKLLEELNKEQDKQVKGIEKTAEAAENQAQRARAELDALKDQASGLQTVKGSVEELSIAKLEAQAIALADEGFNEIAIEAINREIKARRELVAIYKEKSLYEQQAKDARNLEKEFRKTSQFIEKSLTDALFRGFESGKGFAENFKQTLENLFKTLVLRPVIQFAIGGALGLPTASSASSLLGGASGNLGMLSNLLTGGRNFLNGSTITSGFAGGWTNTADWLATSGNNTAAGLGDWMQANPQVGSYLGVAGNALAGYGLGRTTNSLLSNGYTVGRGFNTLADIGSTIAGAIAGPIGGAVVGAIAGAVNRLFGRKLADSGIQGEFGASGFTGSSFEFYKGGLFRSDKTATGILDPEINSLLNQQYAALKLSAAQMALTLGLGTEAIDNFSESIKLSFKGLNEQQIAEKLSEAFANIGELLSSAILGDSEYLKEGETAAIGLARLAGSLSTVNSVLSGLNQTLFDTSLAGADLASQLLDLFGTPEQLQQLAQSYYQNFYSEQERYTIGIRRLTESFSELGFSLPATREAFRALVEAQDKTTAAGREAYAGLLALNGAFADLVPSATAAANSINGLAGTLAGTIASLQDSFSVFMTTASGQNVIDTLLGGYDFATSLSARKSILDQIAAIEQDSSEQINEKAKEVANERLIALNEELRAVTALADAAKNLRKFVDDLRVGASSPLSSSQRLSALQATYGVQLSLARAGDTASFGALQQTAGLLLEQRRLTATTSAEYAIAFGRIAGELDQLAASTIDQTTSQEAALKAQIKVQQDTLDALESIDLTSSRTSSLLESLRVQAEAQFRQDIAAASSQLIATDNIAQVLSQLPPELAAILSSALAAELATQLGSFAAQIGQTVSENTVKAVATGGQTIRATQDQIAVEAIKDVVGTSLTTQIGLVDTLVDDLGYTLDSVNGLITTAVGVWSAADQEYLSLAKNINDIYQEVLGRSAEEGGLTYWTDQVVAGVFTPDNIKQAIIDAATGVDKDSVAAYLASLPKLASGTNYVPKDMAAMLHEGEAVVPKEFNPALNGGGAGSAALIEQIQSLREDSRAQARAVVQLQTRFTKVLERWDTDGLPTERVETV
jgi:hypothetical protein